MKDFGVRSRVARRLSNTIQEMQNLREELISVEMLKGLTLSECPQSARLIMSMCGYKSPEEWHDAVVDAYNRAAKRYSKYRNQIFKYEKEKLSEAQG